MVFTSFKKGIMGIFGPPNVEKMKAKKSVKGLIKALSYKKDSLVRRAAAMALWQIGNKHAVEPLINALGDKDMLVRKYAVKALGRIGDERAVEQLVTSFGDENNGVREAAAFALGEIGSSRALEPLINALEDKNTDVRIYAAKALGKIGDEHAVKPLVTSLGDENNGVHEAVAFALGEIGSSQALEPLINNLADKNTEVRIGAAKALGKIGDERAVKPLVALLHDEGNNVVREAAAFALGKIGGSGMDMLISSLLEKKIEVGIASASALGTFGDAKSVEPLIAVLENNSCDRKVRRASAKALQNLYLSSDNSLDKKLKQRILTFNWLITRMMEDIDKKKEEVLERAKKWWSGKPDPIDNNYVCDVCGRKIKEKKGTSLLGSYMRCKICTERLFERWEENGID